MLLEIGSICWKNLSKKKMSDEEKLSGISPPDLTDTEIGIQEIIDKANVVENDDAVKNNIEKVKQRK